VKSQRINAGIEGGTWQEAVALQFDASSSPILYLGTADAGTPTSEALWAIQRIDVTSGVAITWANGENTFVNVWDDRTSLNYS
jgi:hypothetical protein